MGTETVAQNPFAGADMAGAWRRRYEEALCRLLNDEHADADGLVGVVWEEGILGRISPKDERERFFRRVQKREVWELRTEPELYWRLLYSCAHVRQAIAESWTMASGPVAFAAVMAACRIVTSPYPFFPAARDGSHVDPVLALTEAVAGRARQALIAGGVEPHDPLIPCGAKGAFVGLAVEVERHLEDGLLWLKGQTEADHVALYRYTAGRGVSPSRLDPKSFK